jgi:hypothetical protein
MTHTWEIHNLHRTLSDGLILTASYYCKTELDGESARTVNEIALPYKDPADADYIAYEELTQDIVLGWVTGSLDTASIYSNHSSSIAETINAKNAISTGDGTPWQ